MEIPMNSRRFVFCAAVSAAISSVLLFAQQPARDQWGAMPVSVSSDGAKWTITGKKQTVSFDASTLELVVHAGSTVWAMVPSGANDMLVRVRGREVPLSLADAELKATVPYDAGFKTGIKVTLSNWRVEGVRLDLKLFLTICLEGNDEDLVFDIAAYERETDVRRLDWPTALDRRSFDSTVLSNMRGVLLPCDWPKPYHPIRTTNSDGTLRADDTSEVQSNVIESWSMSWWGFQNGKSAMMVIVETPNDAAYQFSHPAGGPTVIGPRWRTSLGKLRYLRSARMCFFPEGNYVTLAKRYRRYAMDTGLFVPLREKIERQPIVNKLIGTPLTRSGILTNIRPDSNRYKRAKDPKENYRLTTFDQRAEQFRKFKEQGLDRLTVVLTGWPHLGYDRQHPDELPPAPGAGGWEGMKRLAETCRQLGYLFSLHDQYRDYYLDAPSYNAEFAVHEEDTETPPQAFPGTRFGQKKENGIPILDYWDGGAQAYLNSRFMLGHLVKNYRWLFDRGIHPQGIYLDVFGYVPPDEDFQLEHPTTRTDAIRDRANCYLWSRNNVGFVGTEAACDWTVPYADVSSPLGPGKAIAVPLFNLVYHDAILTPYGPNDLYGLLNGGIPQMSGARELSPEDLALVNRMCALNRRVALLEMTGHEFLDKSRRRERTTFSDGTTVTVDWDAKKVEILPELR